ncbi:MAG: ATP-binding cassette domain-containing protein [Coriobacteriia bacterium]
MSVELRAEGLVRRLGDFTLRVPGLGVAAGSTLAVLGPSGAGKSTLLGLLGLLDRPDAGRVLYDGREVGPADRRARMERAAVFQRPYLFRGSVADNVAYGLRIRRVEPAERDERVRDALERVGLAGSERRSVATLSGGEARRVALARALVLRPRLLLLDEPLSHMDPLIRRRLTEDFARILREQGTTTVYVTHDQDEAAIVSDQVVMIRAGEVVASGSTDEVLSMPADEWSADFVGMAPPLHGVVVGNEEGVATVRCGSTDIHAVGEWPHGTRVRVAVRPEDVTLFEGGIDLPASSARNRLALRVEAIAHEGSTVRVTLADGGVRLVALVSRASARELGLGVGREVIATFKATAVRVRTHD